MQASGWLYLMEQAGVSLCLLWALGLCAHLQLHPGRLALTACLSALACLTGSSAPLPLRLLLLAGTLLPAPLLASSPEMAAAMRSENSVSEVIRMSQLSSFSLVGIGAMNESATIVKSGSLNQNDLFYLKMHNAVGDVLCHFLDKNGNLIHTPIEDRLISTSLDQLTQLPNVIGLAAGASNVDAIRAVLRGGYLDILITDESSATLLLKDD